MSSTVTAKVLWPEDLLSPEREEFITLPEELTTRVQRLQEIVGGPIQALPIDTTNFMILNGDGKLQAHKVNVTATMLASIREAISMEDYIAGPAVILDKKYLP